jgi:hypothetical protein
MPGFLDWARDKWNHHKYMQLPQSLRDEEEESLPFTMPESTQSYYKPKQQEDTRSKFQKAGDFIRDAWDNRPRLFKRARLEAAQRRAEAGYRRSERRLDDGEKYREDMIAKKQAIIERQRQEAAQERFNQEQHKKVVNERNPKYPLDPPFANPRDYKPVKLTPKELDDLRKSGTMVRWEDIVDKEYD